MDIQSIFNDVVRNEDIKSLFAFALFNLFVKLRADFHSRSSWNKYSHRSPGVDSDINHIKCVM